MQKVAPHKILPDQRSLPQLYSDYCKSPSVRGWLYLFSALFIAAFPLTTPFILVALLPAFLTNRTPTVPLRLPMEANIRDPNDKAPGGEGLHKARGAVYLGNEQVTGKEAWVSWNDQRLHDYVLGTTGSGKTETILAINANYVLAGSGFLMGDGKGTMMFPKQTATLARIAGADDDHFVISFLSGYKDTFDRSPVSKSNKINPFGEGNASTVKELLTSLMSDGGGENAIFADGAASLADSLSPAWVEGRDRGLFDFDITYISQSLALGQVFKLSQLAELSELSRHHISGYLSNLGYDFDKPASQQPENCTRMHGYYVNYFMRVVTSFAISYRHIYMVKQGEVNLRDCVQSHRCLTFTLPSLEKSGDEVSNLGKTMLVAAKAASSFGLGETMEGSREETVDNLPANYPVPYKFNFDEFSFYIIENFSLMPAQLRGINISCLMGAQDIVGTKRAGEIDAESIPANTRTKMFGGLEDVSTWEKLKELIGEVDMLTYSRFTNKGLAGNRFVPELEVQHTRRVPLEIHELQEQVEGQFHCLQRGKCSKIKTFYPEIDQNSVLDNYYLQRLVPAYKPTDDQLTHLTLMRDFLKILHSSNLVSLEHNELKPVLIDDSDRSETNAILALQALASKSRFSLGDQVKNHQTNPPAPETGHDSSEAINENNPEDEIPVVEQAEETPVDNLEMAIDEWSLDHLDTSEPGQFDANEPSEHASQYEESDDLLAETQASAQEYFESTTPTESNNHDGVFALTSNECQDIEDRYTSLGLMLGDSSETAKKSAQDIVNDIRKRVYYIIPPKPNAEKNIKQKIDALMKQADLFDELG